MEKRRAGGEKDNNVSLNVHVTKIMKYQSKQSNNTTVVKDNIN